MNVPSFKSNLSDIKYPYGHIHPSCHDYLWLNDGCTKAITFALGKFDTWCAYVVELNQQDGLWYAYPPKDAYYFERLYWLGTQVGLGLSLHKVYGHLLHLFELTKQNRGGVDMQVLSYIDRVTREHYGVYEDMAKEVFCLVYYGMIAEENKANTKLGCLIKIHGLHELLMCQKPVGIASNCTRGLSWRDIQAECDALGLIRYI